MIIFRQVELDDWNESKYIHTLKRLKPDYMQSLLSGFRFVTSACKELQDKSWHILALFREVLRDLLISLAKI